MVEIDKINPGFVPLLIVLRDSLFESKVLLVPGGLNVYNGYQLCVVLDIVLSWNYWKSKDCAVEKPFICKIASSNHRADYTTAYPITAPTIALPCDEGSPDDGWVIEETGQPHCESDAQCCTSLQPTDTRSANHLWI